MNKKLGKLLRPSQGWYFAVTALFIVFALVMKQYALAGVEAMILAVVYCAYRIQRTNRRTALAAYIRANTAAIPEGRGTDHPFPTLVVRLGDGVVVYTNDAFCRVSGYQEGMSENHIRELLPGFTTGWLTGGKSE